MKFTLINRGEQEIGQKVLDIGSGTNIDSRATHAIDKEYSGKPPFKNLDYYPKGIDVDKKKLPYPSEFFDIVVSSGGFGYNFGSLRSIKEIWRVLKPKGTLQLNINKRNLVVVEELVKKHGFVDCKISNLRPRSKNYDYCYWVIQAQKP